MAAVDEKRTTQAQEKSSPSNLTFFQRHPYVSFAVMLNIMGVYNQWNKVFWAIVIISIGIIYSFPPKKAAIRDLLLWAFASVSLVAPLFLHNTHPGFRLMFGCQNTFLVLKIWNFVRHMGHESYPLQEIFFYFSHPSAILGDRRPASTAHIEERFWELLPKLAWFPVCLYFVIAPHWFITPFAQGFLFYLAVDCVNELLAIPLMTMSGVYIERFFDKPYLSASPREFWSKRWNVWIQDFQFKNIFSPLKTLGLPTAGAVFGVCLFAIIMHEYQIYVAHLNTSWLGSMALFFVLHFAAATLEVILLKSSFTMPTWLKKRSIMIALHTCWLCSTGHLFIQPFFAAWAAKPLYGKGLNPNESWSWLEYGLGQLDL